MILIRMICFALILVLLCGVDAFAQDITVTRISDDSGVHTDRRPISVGYYDSSTDKTFISWMGPFSSAMVREFDHTTRTWSTDKAVGVSPFADSHNYPALVRTKDGKLLIVYGCHNSVLRVTTSPQAGTIDGQWHDRDLSEAQGASYPVPIVTENGTIYCFYRISMRYIYPSGTFPTDYRPLGFVKSYDNGQTWQMAVKFIDQYPRTDNLCEVYTGKISYQAASDSVSERIHFAWTTAGGGPGNHQHALYRRHVYYAYMDLANEHLFDIKGNDLGTDIDDTEAENNCKVTDTGTPPDGAQVGYQVSVHFMDNGDPLVIYLHEGFKCAYWNGEFWSIEMIDTPTSEPREIEKIGAEAFRAYRTSGKSVYIYRTDNGGESWALENRLIAPSDLARCYVLDNYHPDLKLLLTEMKSDGNNVLEGSRDVFVGGAADINTIEKDAADAPADFELEQNFPNPFNPVTTIRYFLPEKNHVTVAVFDMLGQQVSLLINDEQSTGYHSVVFNSGHLPSGLYYYKIETEPYKAVKKMLLIK